MRGRRAGLRPRAAAGRRPRSGDRLDVRLRCAAAALAFAGSVAGAVLVARWRQWPLEATADAGIRSDAWFVLVLAAQLVVLSALLQVPAAVRRGGSLAAGWNVAAGLLAWIVAAGALARLLTPIAPLSTPGGGRGDPGGLLATVVVFLVAPPVLAMLAGEPFTARHRDEDRLPATGVGLGIGTVLAGAVLVHLLGLGLRGRLYPADGVVPALIGLGVGFLALVATGCLALMRRAGSPADRPAGRMLGWTSATAVLGVVVGLAEAQLARVLPGPVVTLVAVLTVAAVAGWWWRRLVR